ncbi:STAM-binding protein-like A [Frankliniella fusca]|uniref:STAM-binding protein-like A n=1 Tax=Frankliniella fusca TaxID=407009 RepID=A0AAE1H334_9NEOP|nr:STAM-binding protein-like A [Frankliniella fusca]
MDNSKDIDDIPNPSDILRRMAEKVSALEVDHSMAAIRYYRSGLEMVRMADMYLKQGNLKEAYILYLRFITLFLEKIRKHPGWALLPNQNKKEASEKLKEAIPKAEKLKQLLLQQYEQDYQQKVSRLLEIERQRKIAAEQDARKLELEKQKQQQLLKQKQETVIPINRMTSDVVTGPIVPLDSITYPDSDSTYSNNQISQPSAPTIDQSENLAGLTLRDQKSESSRLPTFDRSTKPASLLNLSVQSHRGLRIVAVPSRLVERFLILAHASTLQNIETCGILAGHMDQNQLVISHLIIPHQIGTPDSCTTQNEEEVFIYQDEHNLITLGWIHTHPSQTAFLSSVDLHTHCAYQMMMPEAIAIVCAPRYKDNSIFCLTHNYGLDFIAKCKKDGFHPHPSEPPLFMVAEHARLESDLPVEVIDLRR